MTDKDEVRCEHVCERCGKEKEHPEMRLCNRCHDYVWDGR